MLARKCDRCGKLHEYYGGSQAGGKIEANGIMCIDRNARAIEDAEVASYDLCPKCMNLLADWLCELNIDEL